MIVDLRPTRTRRAPVAADGTLLTAPRVKQRRKGAPSSADAGQSSTKRKREQRRRSPTTESSGLSSAEPSEAGSPERSPSPIDEVPVVTTPRKKRKTDEAVQAAAAESDVEIDEQDTPKPAKSIPTSAVKPATKAKKKRVVDSAVALLDSALLATHIPKAQNQILSVLSGRLPPPGLNDAGEEDGSECIGLEEQWRSLYSALSNTIKGGEGNSALLVGAPGTGKSLLLQSLLRKLDDELTPGSKDASGSSHKLPYHLVHLDGTRQATDRLSLRELARQLVRLGAIRPPKAGEEDALGLGPDDEEDLQGGLEAQAENADEGEDTAALQSAVFSSLATTTSTILTLLSSEEASSRSNLPLIIVLSSFDVFTSRPRQALLYLLLDAVQAGSYRPGLCVVGETSRLDTTELLEKRVRSRFSGRTINTWPSTSWIDVLRRTMALGLSVDRPSGLTSEAITFNEAWQRETDEICKDKEVVDALGQWESMANDTQTLYRYLYPVIASLSSSPSTSASPHAALLEAIDRASAPHRSTLDELTTPEFALLIAAKQLLNKDREVFNFAMCFDELHQFVKRVERDRMGAVTMDFSNASKRRQVNVDEDEDEDALVFQSPRKQAARAGNVNVAWNGLLDRRRALMAFRTLLSLELFQPEVILNSLSHTGATSGTGIAAAAAARRAAQMAKTDFMRVKCTLFPQTIVEAAKSKRRVEPLGIHIIQWATGQS